MLRRPAVHQQKAKIKKRLAGSYPTQGQSCQILLTELACIMPNNVWFVPQEVLHYSTALLQLLTHGESPVQLQVSSEEAPQTGQHFPTGFTPVDLIAAVDQAIGRAAKVSFVQDSTQ